VKYSLLNISIYLIFPLFLTLSSKAQVDNISRGVPYIQKIHLDKYGIENKNLSITQDTNGIIVIGNSNGILKYDGARWSITDTRGVPVVTKNNNGDILVGEYNDIGVLKYKTTRARIVSLFDSLGIKKEIHEKINQIIPVNDTLYFATSSKVYSLSNSNTEKLVEHENLQLFRGENLYVYLEEKGLHRLHNKTLHQLFNTREIKGSVKSLASKHDKVYFSTRDQLYIIKEDKPFKFKNEAESYFQKHNISDIEIIDSASLAIGTHSGGIVLLNENGNILNILNKNTNLFDAQVNRLYFDKNYNLWALHNDGISRIELSTGISYYSDNNGLDGNVNSIKRHKDVLYLATSQGVYFMKENYDNNNFKSTRFGKIKGLNANCYKFHAFDKKLITITDKGAYIINNEQAQLFNNKFKGAYTTSFNVRSDENYFLIGDMNGLFLVEYANGLFIRKGRFRDINNQVSSIVEDSQGHLWVSVKQEGIFRISSFSDNLSQIGYKFYPLKEISKDIPDWVKLYQTSQGIFFSSSVGLYRYDERRDTFYKDSILTKGLDSKWIFPIVEDKAGNLWFNVVTNKENPKNKLIVKRQDLNEKQKTIHLSLNRIKNFYIKTIKPESENIIWFGGPDGVVRMDLKNLKERTTSFQTLISKVKINQDSVISFLFTGKNQRKTPNINHLYNDLKFEFAATHFISENELLFSTYLQGYDDEWSDWSTQQFKNYNNLPGGNYTFKVKAKDIYGNLSPPVTYRFSVDPPIYLTWYAYLIYAVFIGLVFFVLFKWRSYFFAKEKFKLENIINERTEDVLLQKEKTDRLIERLLPRETVSELKSGRKAGPYHYNMVTVLFGDIKGFTKITENLEQVNATRLLDKLDKFFLEFDSIVEKHNIEKIKTIGDAYMCAGGIPDENHTNPIEVIVAALEMQNYMKQLKNESEEFSNIWDLRIGVDTGPIIAGVIGRSKVNYDIWGSTVNMASRMESSGDPGKINITGNTFMLVKDFFICKYRGRMPVKNKGEIDMYFIEGFKPNFAEDLRGLKPNNYFQINLQLLRFNDIEEMILEKMEKGLPKELQYHNVKHTIDVVTQVELIGKAENVDTEGILLLKTAALFHDLGHISTYDNHEDESGKIAQKILPDFSYSEKQISKIVNLILATKMPPDPKSHLEKIICDADLDYLGRADFVPVAYNLYRELRNMNKISSFEEWKKIQIDFIKQHSYFTETAQKLREVNKQKQLEIIINEMNFEEKNQAESQEKSGEA
jgi:class 3 adenylate cyclase/ligand-binding sensor domain-containing protein